MSPQVVLHRGIYFYSTPESCVLTSGDLFDKGGHHNVLWLFDHVSIFMVLFLLIADSQLFFSSRWLLPDFVGSSFLERVFEGLTWYDIAP
jgi:hypothetical protein